MEVGLQYRGSLSIVSVRGERERSELQPSLQRLPMDDVRTQVHNGHVPYLARELSYGY